MAISDDLNSIRTHLEDDYKALETLGVSVEDRNIENIKDMANQIYAKFPKTDYAEGSNITLSNTLKGKLDFEDGIVGIGDTKQITTEGYNLLPYVNTTRTINGITFTNNGDGTITANGTASDNAIYPINIDGTTVTRNISLGAGTYVAVDGVGDYTNYFTQITNTSIYLNTGSTGTTGVSATGTSTETTNFSAVIYIRSGKTVNNLVFKPMIVKSTDVSKPFEQYSGGYASPSPNWEQDIEVVRGKNRVETTQKGYWDNNGYWIDTNYNCSSNKIEVQEGKTYVGSIFDKNKNYINKMVYVVFDKNDTFIRYSGDDTITIANGEKYVSIRSYNAQTSYVENDNYLIQFEENTRHTSYLPYNTLEVVERGKNEFSSELEVGGFDANGLNANINTRLRSKDYIQLKDNINYTISATNNTTGNLAISISYYTTNDFTTARTGYINWSTLPYTFSIPSGCKYIRILFRITDDRTVSFTDVSNVMLVEGNTSAPYEPYQTPQTYQLSLGEYEFAKIGNYVDTIEYDVENDKVYKNEKIGKVVLNGSNTENWERRDTSTSGVYRFYCSSYESTTRHATDNSEVALIYCDKFVPTSPNSNYNKTNGLTISVGGGIFIYYDTTNAYTTTEFKTWLSTHNLILYYVLATATREEIIGTLKDQIKALYNSHSFTGTTIIEINGQLPLIIKVRALKGE